MTLNLSPELQQALDENHGFVQGSSFVVMSIDMYRSMMGIGSDEDLQASLKAIDEGLDDIEAGRTRPYREVLAELGRHEDLQR